MTEQHDNDNNNEPIAMTEPGISKATAMNGLGWIGQSFSLFARSPSIWVVMLIIYFGITILLSNIPLLVLLPTMLSPIFNAGFIFGARAVDQGNMLEIDHLFAGFKQQFKNLFRLGVLYFLINLLIIALVTLALESFTDINSLRQLEQAQTALEMEKILSESPELLVAFFKALMIGLVLSIPMVMASWFAPALILFHQVPPARAMLLSLKACNQNILPFLVFGLLILPLILLSLVPFGLGLLIMIPVLLISQYSSYKTIFVYQPTSDTVFRA